MSNGGISENGFPDPTERDDTYAGRLESTPAWLARPTLDMARECRSFLNRNLAALPEKCQEGIGRRLKTDMHYVSAFFELVVARTLQTQGATITCEPANSVDGTKIDFMARFPGYEVGAEASTRTKALQCIGRCQQITIGYDSNMELRHLRYFVTVAEELHFGRAAERLHIAQPALSKQVSNLEGELGVRLFDRTKRRVRLTEAGRVFLEESRGILERTEQAAETARRAVRGQLGRLAIGFIGPAVYSVIPEILRLYRERFPDVELALHEWTSTKQIRRLHSRFIEVGFVRPPLGDDTLVFQTVWREPIVMILPEGHPLADEDEISLKAFANEPFIMVPRRKEPAVYDLFISSCRSAGFNPQVVQEAHQIHTIVGLVVAQIGVSFTAAPVGSIQRPGVVCRPLEAPSPELELAVVRRREDPTPALRAFLEVVEEVTAPQPAANL